MGVTGLWKLIEPCGKPVPVETLEGKVLAVDISIWLHQVIKGFQDGKGSALANAHLLGLFHRLCKLLYYRVRPVFVFDGGVPQLKRDTIARRQVQRTKLNSEAERIQALLLQSLAQEKVVQQALGATATELLLKSPVKRLGKAAREDRAMDELFKLPELPIGGEGKEVGDIDGESDSHDASTTSFDYSNSTASNDDSSFDDSNLKHSYNVNLQAIDVRSQHFRNLPADMRHEILVDIKETRKESSWGRLHELPSKSDAFSSFQMKRLLKRRAVQESLEEAEQEMGGHTLTYTELKNYFTEEGIVAPSAIEKNSKRICSDENTRYLLVRDLKRKLAQVKKEGEDVKNIKLEEKEIRDMKEEGEDVKNITLKEENVSDMKLQTPTFAEEKATNAAARNQQAVTPIDELPTTSKQAASALKQTKNLSTISEALQEEETPTTSKKASSSTSSPSSSTNREAIDDDELERDFQADLELAIALSLGETQVYREEDYEFESDKTLRLNREQRYHLQNAATGPARAYMIEYAGMNEEEVVKMVEKSQLHDVDKKDFECSLLAEGGEFKESATDIVLHVTDSEDEGNVRKSLDKSPKLGGIDINSSELKNANKSELSHKSDDSDANDKTITGPELCLYISSSSDTDSDLEEVPDSQPNRCPKERERTQQNKKVFEIVVNLEKPFRAQDDLFADIFEEEQGNVKISNQENDKSVLLPKSVKETNRVECDKNTASNDLQKEEDQHSSIDIQQKLSQNDNEKMFSILNDLKKQMEDVKQIRLEDIKLKNVVIDVFEEEEAKFAEAAAKLKPKSEIIEILDDEDAKRASAICISPRKSPKLKTPTKNKVISEFFNTDYVIKRSPDKPIGEQVEQVPKVISPFFVKKSPRSQRKRTAEKDDRSPTRTPAKNSFKASKALFDKIEDDSVIDGEGIEPLKETTPNTEDLITEAAEALKSKKTTDELQNMANDLAKERRELEYEQNRQDRMGMTISERMVSDCQELLRLFGIPYIMAPMEAEAQCAFLDLVELTNGTITDDSDIWLFGGRTVYKNFFAQDKHVLEFRAEKIENNFNCDRKKLIQLACLVGSDYTTGIHGIGAVTALEILASFSAVKDTEPAPNETSARDTMPGILSTLNKFRDWWQAHKTSSLPPGSLARKSLQKKLKNIELHEGFPNVAVVEAYLTPVVDESKESLSWGQPDVESIREFTKKQLGWTSSKTNDMLNPVIKKLNEKKTQATIRNYFNVKSAITVRQLGVSKRVQTAIDRMGGKIEAETPERPPPKKRTKKKLAVENTEGEERASCSKPRRRLRNNKVNHESTSQNEKEQESESQREQNQTVTKATRKRSGTPTTATNRKQAKEVIPQREKALKQMRQNKEKAAKVLKNGAAKKATAKKRGA